MFNDDVLAICPECNGSNVTYDASKIACLECKFEEPLGLQTLQSVPALKTIQADHMMTVLRRWQFAG
jgi:hypothetical protein